MAQSFHVACQMSSRLRIACPHAHHKVYLIAATCCLQNSSSTASLGSAAGQSAGGTDYLKSALEASAAQKEPFFARKMEVSLLNTPKIQLQGTYSTTYTLTPGGDLMLPAMHIQEACLV